MESCRIALSNHYTKACHQCKIEEGERQLYSCGDCESVYYCSIQHQLDDLDGHRKLCDLMKRFNENSAWNHEIQKEAFPVLLQEVNGKQFFTADQVIKRIANLSIHRQGKADFFRDVLYPSYLKIGEDIQELFPSLRLIYPNVDLYEKLGWARDNTETLNGVLSSLLSRLDERLAGTAGQ